MSNTATQTTEEVKTQPATKADLEKKLASLQSELGRVKAKANEVVAFGYADNGSVLFDTQLVAKLIVKTVHDYRTTTVGKAKSAAFIRQALTMAKFADKTNALYKALPDLVLEIINVDLRLDTKSL